MPHLGAQIAALVDDQLPPDQVEAALAHLEHCEVCRAGVRAQRLAKNQMGTLPAVQPPDELLASLCAIGSRRVPHPPAGRSMLRATRLVVAGGLTVAVASVASMVVNPHTAQTGPGPTRQTRPQNSPAPVTSAADRQREGSGPAGLPVASLVTFTR